MFVLIFHLMIIVNLLTKSKINQNQNQMKHLFGESNNFLQTLQMFRSKFAIPFFLQTTTKNQQQKRQK